LNSLTTTIRNV